MDTPVARSRTDLAVAGVVLAFCAVVFALTFGFDTVPAALMGGLGAELFPRLVLAVIALLAVLIGLGIGTTPMAAPPRVAPMVWITGGVVLAFMAAVELIGLWPSSFLLLVGLGRLWGERRLWALAASAGGLCIVLYLLFVKLLGGSFPNGLIARFF
jgi:putative tricarboxylic transport membrane protein